MNLIEGAIEAIIEARKTCANDEEALQKYLDSKSKVLFIGAGDINQIFRVANSRWAKIRLEIIKEIYK